jgi:hypothetical protein
MSTVDAVELKVGHDRLSLSCIRPYHANASVYGPRSDKDIAELAASIRENGLLEPIVVARDGVILSGHSRYRACRLLRLKSAPCRVVDAWSTDESFLPLLIEFNRQRIKTIDELLREHVVRWSPEDAHEALVEYREQKATPAAEFLKVGEGVRRKKISKAKAPMIEAIRRVLEANRAYWPLTDRTIHYELLNDPPLIHASKPNSRYENTKACYSTLTELLTRARVFGLIPYDCIEDPTRKTQSWPLHREVGGFIKSELDGFLKIYWRDLMQSQPNHVEIVGEKNTVEASIRGVAAKYTIQYTLGRGYCSLDPRRRMVARFKASGKEKLIVLFLTDFDPEGEDIIRSFVTKVELDFAVKIHPVKVCLTLEQARGLKLHTVMKAKAGSSRRKGFVDEHGEDVYELEALPTPERSRLLEEAILGVIDVDAFNREVEREKQDAAKLAEIRSKLGPLLLASIGDGEGGR